MLRFSIQPQEEMLPVSKVRWREISFSSDSHINQDDGKENQIKNPTPQPSGVTDILLPTAEQIVNAPTLTSQLSFWRPADWTAVLFCHENLASCLLSMVWCLFTVLCVRLCIFVCSFTLSCQQEVVAQRQEQTQRGCPRTVKQLMAN